ncbi:hypothetical protein KJ865_15135, partial [Myxococcota bacterium]|nr:hypothetical protein [Myxococcota bacterium]
YDYSIINEKISPYELQGQFDFPLYGALRDALIPAQVNLSNLNAFVYSSFIDYQGISDLDWSKEGDAANGTLMGNFLGNHDVERFSSVAAGDASGDGCQAFNAPLVAQSSDSSIYQRMALGFAFLLSVRGLPVIYYGDEIGLAGVKDPDNRRTMVFEDGQLLSDQVELRQRVSAIIHARNDFPSLRRGRYDAFHGEPGCLVFLKSLGTERVLVVLSGGEGCNATVTMKEGYGFQDGESLTDILSGTDQVTINSSQIVLTEEPWSVRLYHMDTVK